MCHPVYVSGVLFVSMQTDNLHRAETGATYGGRDGDRKRRPQEIGTRKIKEGVERGREGRRDRKSGTRDARVEGKGGREGEGKGGKRKEERVARYVAANLAAIPLQAYCNEHLTIEDI